jgi:hypothetical protein
MANIGSILDNSDFQLVQLQERAHDVYRAIDLPAAPAPLSGESPRSYRERLVGRLQHHSDVWRKADLSRLPSSTLEIAESQIFEAAKRWGSDKTRANPDGTLRERKVVDHAGREWTEFAGSPAAWMTDFMPPMRKVLVGVTANGRQHPIPGRAVLSEKFGVGTRL